MAQRTCSVGGCEDKHYGKGYCRKHWYEARRNGTLPAPLCSVEGCESVVVGQGLCHKHWQRIKLRGIENVGEPAQRDLSISERFWEKVEKTETCWNWTAAVTRGYGRFFPKGKPEQAHRVAYELLVGPIPEGLTIDHLCFNTLCVNPDHLEPVTLSENVRRMHAARATDHCPRGHEFTAENTRLSKGGKSRHCRQCDLRENRRK